MRRSGASCSAPRATSCECTTGSVAERRSRGLREPQRHGPRRVSERCPRRSDQTEKRLLLEGLRRIAVDDQILIELYYWEKLTGPELADVLDLGEPAVRSRLHRAKKRLADALRTIAESPGLLQSTLDDIEAWARRAGELADRERIERDRQRPVSHDDS